MGNAVIETKIRKFALKNKIDAIEVGIYRNKEVEFFSSNETFGKAFQIGSITKIYTAFAIMLAIDEKLISRETNLVGIFGGTIEIDKIIGEITINELLTHSSGIPRIPESLLNIMSVNLEDPYRQLTHENIYTYLKNPDGLGEKKPLYSNVGYGLLGIILEHMYNMPLKDIFEIKIFQPLNMSQTSLNISSKNEAILVQGYNVENKRATLWYDDTLAGAGSIISTTNDCMKFLAAHFEQNYLGNILMNMTHLQTKGMATCWLRFGKIFRILGAGSTLFHNGGTGGFHAYTTINVKKKKGMIMLINKAGNYDNLDMEIMEKL